MKIFDYFNKTDNENGKNGNCLGMGPFYNATIENFFDNCIEKELLEIKDNICEWDNLIKNYIDLKVPVYWVRRYESSTRDSSNKQDNRRGGLTLIVENEIVKFAYAFISNYDAQEFYHMIRSKIDVPTCDEFQEMMTSGQYQMHYDPKGSDCKDDQIAFFEKRGAIKGGVLNAQNWYLAHIYDVNGIEYQNKYGLSKNELDDMFFPKGDIKDWVKIANQKTYIKRFLNGATGSIVTTGIDRHVRILELSKIRAQFRLKTGLNGVSDKEIDEFYKENLQARFLRFIHPCNYFLVPARNCEADYIFAKKEKSIGEYKPLVAYVNEKMKTFFNQTKDVQMKMMLPDDSLYKGNIKDLGHRLIHICYGAKYNEKILLDICETVNLPSRFTDIENFIEEANKKIKNINIIIKVSGQGITNTLQSWAPNKEITQEKICYRIPKSKYIYDSITLDFEEKKKIAGTKKAYAKHSNQQRISTAAGNVMVAKKSKYSDDIKMEVAKVFLTSNVSLIEIEKNIIKCTTDRHGATAKSILDSLQISNKKKGVLVIKNIDEEIELSDGIYRDTLIKLKEKYKLV